MMKWPIGKKVLKLGEYADEISLFKKVEHAPPLKNRKEIQQAIQELLGRIGSAAGQLGAFRDQFGDDPRILLHGVLNILEPHSLDDESIALLDALLQSELQNRTVHTCTDMKDMPTLNVNDTKIIVFHGDITELRVDAIVNAANNRLLGCFQPLHLCIDNVIHSRAGVRLRDDCSTIMSIQGFPEPTGCAKITRAYNLPSRYVLHTVGPIVQRGIKGKHPGQLRDCYVSCLDLCHEMKTIQSLAFCCISTGVFGYPAQSAAETSFEAVLQWLEANPGILQTIVFTVYSQRDWQIYDDLVERENGKKNSAVC